MSDGEFNGTYKRRQGEKREYQYKASFSPSEQGFIWNAKIRSEGECKGTCGGEVLTTASDLASAMVKMIVEDSIEKLVNVVE